MSRLCLRPAVPAALCLTLLGPSALPLPAFAAEVTQQDRLEALRRYRAGEDLMRQETFEEAALEFQAAARLDPLFVLAYYSQGQALMSARRYSDAVQAFLGCRGAIEEFGKLRSHDRAAAEVRITDEVRELKDHITALQSGRIKTVSGNATILSLQERVRLLEDSRLRGVEDRNEIPPEFTLALGSAYFRAGQLAEAEREYKAALTVDPKMGAVYNNLAVLYLLSWRFEEAEAAMKLAEKNGYPVDPGLKADLQKSKSWVAKP